MIWIRRSLALVVSVVFIGVFLFILFLFRVNNTILEPQFYIEQLRKADPFNFAYDTLIPSALSEFSLVDTLGDDSAIEILSVLFTNIEEATVTSARVVLPPAWLQLQSEQVVSEILPYMTGDTNQFKVSFVLSDRLTEFQQEFKKLLRTSGVYGIVSMPEFATALDNQISRSNDLPFGIVVSSKEIVSVLKEITPADWIEAQSEAVLDGVFHYLSVGDETRIFHIDLKDMFLTALAGKEAPVKRLLRDLGAYDDIYREIIIPELTTMDLAQNPFDEAPDSYLVLPVVTGLELSFTQQEIKEILGDILAGVSSKFIETQIEAVIDDVAPYAVGDSDSFVVALEFRGLVGEAMPTVQQNIYIKLEETFQALPPCGDVWAVLTNNDDANLPVCRDRTLEDMVKLAGMDLNGSVITNTPIFNPGTGFYTALQGIVAEELATAIQQAVPEKYVFTDSDFREILNQEQEKSLDKILAWTANGFTYTELDLIEDLSQEQMKAWNDVLTWIRHGYTFTHEDFENLVIDSAGAGAMETVFTVQQNIAMARNFLPLLYLVSFLMLVALAVLGANSWNGSFRWGAGALAVASIFAVIAFQLAQWIVVDLWSKSEILLGDGVSTNLLRDWAVVLVDTVAKDFFGGIVINAFILLVFSTVVFAATIVWPKQYRQA